MLKNEIIAVAVRMARTNGIRSLTRDGVAAEAKVGMGTINYHFTDMDGLRAAVVEYAIENEIVEVLAQARAERHSGLKGRLSSALKERVAQHIAGK